MTPGHQNVAALLAVLRTELRRRKVTGKAIAQALGVAEPTVRRWLRGEGLLLERLEDLCGLAGVTLRDLISLLPESGATRFTLAQERVLAADRPLAFLFFAVLNGAQPDAFGREFRMPRARVEAYVERLIRLGLLDRAPSGRIRALTTRSISWRPGGPLAVAFDKQIKPLFLSLDFGAEDAAYVSDMVRLSEAGRAQAHAMFAALRLEIHKLAETDQAAQFDHYDWSGVLMLVRPLDMTEVTRTEPVAEPARV
jgi:transcriptional regulator with XRE-family HTH domain